MPVPSGLPGPAVSARVKPSHVLYLHGFASSARSTKAGYFADRLRPHGLELRCPDFNEPDFATMTMTRMLDRLGAELEALPPGPVALIGSSLGGALAILAADRLPRVDRLLLLAPAVMFSRPGHHLLPPDKLAAWQRDGAMAFFHYAYGEERRLNVSFHADSLQYDPMTATVRQPALVFQGRRDESVDHRTVEQFARGRSNVTLILLDDDHSLAASLPVIWDAAAPFFGLA